MVIMLLSSGRRGGPTVSEHTYSHVLFAGRREETSDASSVKLVIMWFDFVIVIVFGGTESDMSTPLHLETTIITLVLKLQPRRRNHK
jgi:hypothetical protein